MTDSYLSVLKLADWALSHSTPSMPHYQEAAYRHEAARKAVAAAVAAIPPAAAAAGLPAGWRAVPVEPTPEMHLAACRAADEQLHAPANGSRFTHSDAYRAMLAAAPALPADPVAESQPALSETQQYRAGYGDGVRRAAKVCDEKYRARVESGHPREAGTARALAEEIRNLQSAVPVVAPVPAASEGWISVLDRMPEDGDTVLVFTPAAPGLKVWIDTWQEQHEAPVSFSSATIPIGLGWDDHEFEAISHWRRLPAAPATSDKAEG